MSGKQKDQGEFYMGGTDGTGEYLVYAVTAKGRVGVRDLGTHSTGGGCFGGPVTTYRVYRVRVEPREVALESIRGVLGSGWKQPGDGQFRFSREVKEGDQLQTAASLAFKALGVTYSPDDETQQVNPKAPKWVKDLLNKKQPPGGRPKGDKGLPN